MDRLREIYSSSRNIDKCPSDFLKEDSEMLMVLYDSLSVTNCWQQITHSLFLKVLEKL